MNLGFPVNQPHQRLEIVPEARPPWQRMQSRPVPLTDGRARPRLQRLKRVRHCFGTPLMRCETAMSADIECPLATLLGSWEGLLCSDELGR